MVETPPVSPFQYSDHVHVRRHGLQGYVDPQRYKPWLRDEFQFRCVYCLCRERWCPDGEDAFSVEHYRPRSLAPDDVCRYDNLLYTCCRCNSSKRDLTDVLNPSEVLLAHHLEIIEDGTIRGLTDDGRELIGVCQLDRTNLTEFRRGIFDVLRALNDLSDDAKRKVLRRYLGFPSNLPRLSTLRPPQGNSRVNGLESSFYERRNRSELPEIY